MTARKKPELLVRVRGRGLFPIDMLRYDRGFPYSEIDSAKINDTFTNVGETREVELYVTSNGAPTAPRWASFGWVVTHVWDGSSEWKPYDGQRVSK